MTNLKRISSALLIASSLSLAVPAPQAKAGILLTPIVVGVALIVVGAYHHNAALIVLNADGSLSQSSLEASLSKTYSFIDDRAVINELATAIRDKAANTPAVDGKKVVSLSRNQLLDILAPTGLADLQPEAVEGLIRDLE